MASAIALDEIAGESAKMLGSGDGLPTYDEATSNSPSDGGQSSSSSTSSGFRNITLHPHFGGGSRGLIGTSMRDSTMEAMQATQNSFRQAQSGRDFQYESQLSSQKYSQFSALSSQNYQQESSLQLQQAQEAAESWTYETGVKASTFESYGMPSFLAFDPAAMGDYQPTQVITPGGLPTTAPPT